MNNKKQEEEQSRMSIISLTPTNAIYDQLKNILREYENYPEDQFDQLLNEDILQLHSVPVLVPQIDSPDELVSFIQQHSERLINIMLTAWPFPLDWWDFGDKNYETFAAIANLTYYPFVIQALAKDISSTLELAVTYVTPTEKLLAFYANLINSDKVETSQDELSLMNYLFTSGIAIITNQIDAKNYENALDFLLAQDDIKNFLTVFQGNILKILLNVYIKNPENLPPEIDDDHFSEWFDSTSFTGIYVLDPALLQK
ncbi:hypothetical protein [Legionella sp. W05-934-2]|jgi:hypothetical protein|uniref:hypothetical protein n=1 Tax=Legionella sp. W05-934-2 TaxID=1198649 RepID=UPI003463790A